MKILFVCIENAGRSQLAQAFARKWAPPGIEAFSAGSKPASSVHPVAVDALREKGIDIRGEIPKGFGDLPEGPFDLVIGMGCGDACPVTRARKVLNWEIPNPKGQPLEEVRLIRDDIESRVRALLEELATS